VLVFIGNNKLYITAILPVYAKKLLDFQNVLADNDAVSRWDCELRTRGNFRYL